LRAPQDQVLNPALLAIHEKTEPWSDRGIHIPDFGSIYLGEMYMLHGVASVSMIRLELGCATAGTIVIAQAHVNGHQIPP
jgi:hypothetical protein